ncbi:MAG: MarR family winged helix-turn-helix transcriptional regulator [Candidatus Promineifilaceae bacterium]
MASSTKQGLKKQVMLAAREYGIGSVLFRRAVGEILGVNATDMECLGVLFFKGVATPSELATNTGLSSGATTAMLDRLERGGLIERRPNPEDRRSTLIVLANNETTAKASALFAPLREAQDRILSGYSEAELNLLADYFRRTSNLWQEERQKLQARFTEKV